MQLSRLSILLAAFCLACTDSSGPGSFARTYVLGNVDGRTLPTPIAFFPGPTATIASSTLGFDWLGIATFTDHRIESNGLDHVVTGRYTYRVDGENVSFTPAPCPGLALCVLVYTVTGRVIEDNLTVVLNGTLSNNSITLNYRAKN